MPSQVSMPPARDDATAKLEAAASKDAAGLCIALLGVASDAGCASARRLAAATFTRNCLRKQWGARDETTTHEPARVTPEARADVRGASLRALVAAPPDTRRLLADCLRLAATDAVGWSASGTTDARDGATVAFAAPGTDGRDRLASAAALVEDVIAVSAARAFCSFEENTTSASHGLLLAAHVASMPFQYFRDPTVAFEAAHPAAERLSASLVAPRLVPALTRAAAGGLHERPRRRAVRARRVQDHPQARARAYASSDRAGATGGGRGHRGLPAPRAPPRRVGRRSFRARSRRMFPGSPPSARCGWAPRSSPGTRTRSTRRPSRASRVRGSPSPR
jgi:hypothetical protein